MSKRARTGITQQNKSNNMHPVFLTATRTSFGRGGRHWRDGSYQVTETKTDQPSYTHAKSRDPQNNKESSGMSKPFLLKVEVRVVDLP